MCDHKVLSHNQYGYIIRCMDCDHFQIGFGTTVISFSPDQFEKFRKSALQQSTFFQKEVDSPLRKDINLPSFNKNVQLMLNYFELVELLGLVEEANVMLQLQKLLESNEN